MTLFGSDEEFELNDEDLDSAFDDITKQINNAHNQRTHVSKISHEIEQSPNNIIGSPGALKLFGITSPTVSSPVSQDLFGEENKIGLKFSFQKNPKQASPPTTPQRKRPCLRTPQQSFSLTTPNNLTSTMLRTPQMGPPQTSETPNIFITPKNKTTTKFLNTPTINSARVPLAEERKIEGIYSSQEEVEILTGPVWNVLSSATNNEVLQPYCVKSVLNGKCLYRGKAPHLAVIVKSIEQLSSNDTSVLVCDKSGEIRGTIHRRVMDKWGSLLEEGVGLLLRQVTAFSLGSMKYINITLPNIVYVINEAGLDIQQDVLDRHLLEISEVSVLRLESPDMMEDNTPRQITTPNIKPTLRLNPGSRTTSPQQTRTMSPQFRSRSPQQFSNKSTPIRRDMTLIRNTAPTRNNNTQNSVSVKNMPLLHQKAVTPGNASHSESNNLSVKHVTNSNANQQDLSKKEQDEISQLLDGIEDDLFNDDDDLDI